MGLSALMFDYCVQLFYEDKTYHTGKNMEQNAENKNAAGRSSREVIYQYLLEQMKQGFLLPGSVLNLSEISKKLNISNTPLRDSLIKLEAEGFVTIYPRSKVVVNSLELEDFPFLYSTIGNLEYMLIATALDKYTPEITAELRSLAEKMKEAVKHGELVQYDGLHYAFHDMFVRLNRNKFAERIIMPIKSRLWDFPRRNFIKEWFENANKEHDLIVDAIEKKDLKALEYAIKDLHWDFDYNRPHIEKCYHLK